MALQDCKECGKPVSTEAKACPNCGAKAPKQTSVLTWVFGGALLLAIVVVTSRSSDTSRPAAANSMSAPQAVLASAPAAPTTPTKHWEYLSGKDEMTGKYIALASVEANEKANFRFPYDGGSTATLSVRRHPKYGLDISISMSKGHFLCHRSDCDITVRFDDAPPRRYTGVKPTDGSSDRVFFNGQRKLLDELRKAKITKIEATFYQDGPRVMTFNTAGLAFQ